MKYFINYFDGADCGYVGYDNEPCSSIDMAMTFDSKDEAEAEKEKLQIEWKSILKVGEFDFDE